MARKTTPLSKRLWSKVRRVKGDPHACWLWKPPVDHNGYGRIYAGEGRCAMTAHRAAWIVTYGDPGDDVEIITCPLSKRCCKPEHLAEGKPGRPLVMERVLMKKGQQRKTESSPRERLKPAQVRDIYTSGDKQDVLAKRYNTSQAAVSQIRNRVTHREITKGL